MINLWLNLEGKISMSLSQTALRKLPTDSTVKVVSAPFVRFRRGEDRQWHEVPRHGVTPRVLPTAELFLLGVDLTN